MRLVEVPPEAEAEWRAWVEERPPGVREIARRFDPWSLYRMKSTGQRVTVVSFYENGTLKVEITGQFNMIAFDRQVFGIDPDDLEPCDLPPPGESVGALLSSTQVDDNIYALRVAVRPDLWAMGDDGKATRRN